MQYKVINSLVDMKLLQDGKLVVIKRGTSASVSVEEYQYLSRVYGMAVKGEKEIVVRVTEPVRIVEAKEVASVVESSKKNKRKKR